MARQRFIWPDIWDDPDLGRVSPLAFILYIGCFSNADDEGRLLGDPVWLTSTIFRYRQVSVREVENARDELGAACRHFVTYMVRERCYIAFTNWSEWQHPKYPRPSKLPPPPKPRNWRKAAQLSDNSSGNDSGNRSGKGSEGGSEPLGEASGNDSPAGRDGLGSTPLPPVRKRSRTRKRAEPTPSYPPAEEVINLPDLTPAQRRANLKRARELAAALDTKG